MICDGFDLFLLVHPLGMVGDNLGMVGDNLDKNVSRRYQRIDRQTQSYHFFQTYAVGDRIDLSFTLIAFYTPFTLRQLCCLVAQI